MNSQRPPLPPFIHETALQKVRLTAKMQSDSALAHYSTMNYLSKLTVAIDSVL